MNSAKGKLKEYQCAVLLDKRFVIITCTDEFFLDLGKEFLEEMAQTFVEKGADFRGTETFSASVILEYHLLRVHSRSARVVRAAQLQLQKSFKELAGIPTYSTGFGLLRTIAKFDLRPVKI